MKYSPSACFGLLLLALTLVVGCSDTSTPTVSDAKKLAEERVEKFGNGLLKLVSFEKKDGKQIQTPLGQLYEMEWVAKIEFIDDCVWQVDRFGALSRAEAKGKMMPFGFMEKAKPMNKGQRVEIDGKTTFERTEKGWRQFEM